MLEIIKGVLGTLFKMSETEITDALKSDGSDEIDEAKILPLILSKDKDRISKIKTEIPKWDDAVKKATKEVWTKVEAELKEKFEVESDLKGDELIEFVSAAAKEKAKGDPGKKKEDMTEDDIKKHPVFLTAEKLFKKQLADKDTEKLNEIKKLEDSFSQKENLSKVRNAALTKFKKLGDVILPADAEKADKLIQRLLLDELNPYTYQVDDKGEFLILNADGKRLEDAHGNAMVFDDLIDKIAKDNFEFKVSKEKSSPANGGKGAGDGGGGGGGDDKKYKGKLPQNKDEYLAIMTSADYDSAAKLEVKQQFSGKFN